MQQVTCARCGTSFDRNPIGGPPKYCPPCRRPAALEQKRLDGRRRRLPHRSKRTCPTCGTRILTGHQNAGTKYCSDDCKPRCTVDGCDQPQRKRTWCASHYAQWKHTGQPPRPFLYKWGSARTTPLTEAERRAPVRYGQFTTPVVSCKNCGAPSGRARFCSAICRYHFTSHGGPRPRSTTCVACGTEIDLTIRGKRGQRRKANVKFCRPCKQDYRKYKLSARQLAQRDGTDCGICGEPVDMSLHRSDSNMCASVDHIIPRALGGTHDPENLQLAHLYCNQVKSDLRGREPLEEVR